jgi:hypothetical protein
MAIGGKKLKPTYADKISRSFVYDCIQRAANFMGGLLFACRRRWRQGIH